MDFLTPRLWIDVEDLFEYGRENPRPSGIQRLAFEVYAALHARYSDTGRVHFVRHDTIHNSFTVVPWAEIAALFGGLVRSEPVKAMPGRQVMDRIRPHSAPRNFVRRLVHRLPVALRVAAIDVILLQVQVLHAWAALFTALARSVAGMPQRLRRGRIGASAGRQRAPGPTYESLVAAGDVVVVLGSPWSHPDYAALIREQRKRHGIRFALLVYDLIPLRRPEWCDRGLVRLFRSWFGSVFPLCDVVFAISRATASDVEAYARAQQISLPGAVIPIPIGTGFGAGAPPAVSDRHPLLPPGDYALIVSTIEARKNHLLLFRVWRRMLEEMPAEQVPALVFAGRVGWLVQDLIQQIANTDSLNGKLVILENPSDEDLVALYGNCLFTMFPSFYEGWGLPVTESLAAGKPCVISNRTSLPEAGSGLCRSFDPDDLNDAYAVIRGVIEDRAGLAAWEAQVRREFRPVPWSATVDAIIAGLDEAAACQAPLNATTTI